MEIVRARNKFGNGQCTLYGAFKDNWDCVNINWIQSGRVKIQQMYSGGRGRGERSEKILMEPLDVNID